MPTPIRQVPKYRKHHASGQAIVTVAGKTKYLGPHGTRASHLEYDRLIGEWLAAGRPTHQADDPADITVSEVCAVFLKHAKQYYRKDGKPTGAADVYHPVLKLLKTIYGKTRAAEFGPLAAKALLGRMVRDGASRSYANGNLGCLKRIFRWAASEELIPASVPQALATVVDWQYRIPTSDRRANRPTDRSPQNRRASLGGRGRIGGRRRNARPAIGKAGPAAGRGRGCQALHAA